VLDRSYMHKTTEWLQSFTSNRLNSQLRPHEFKTCTKISITGGKGGVGKTSIALKTACELARAGYRTLLIDCDSNLSNTAIKLGLPIDNKFERLLSAASSFEECLIVRGQFPFITSM
jgi:flagellar biosynthesis protein FlhG